MHERVTVLGTIDAGLNRIIDTDHNPTIFRWLTLIGLETGQSLCLAGRGHRVSTMLDLIVDGVMGDERDFVRLNRGAVVVIGLPQEGSS
jgi:hypothetical protein